jgi:hypothetical protein
VKRKNATKRHTCLCTIFLILFISISSIMSPTPSIAAWRDKSGELDNNDNGTNTLIVIVGGGLIITGIAYWIISASKSNDTPAPSVNDWTPSAEPIAVSLHTDESNGFLSSTDAIEIKPIVALNENNTPVFGFSCSF